MLALRQEVLRAPLGLDIYAESLCEEASQWLYGLIDNDQLMACLIAKPVDDTTAKLRQMAVSPAAQGKGYGAILLRYVEQQLTAKGIHHITLHARCSASEFYTKAGYGIQSEVFAEVGIPHVSMAKDL
jgi:predicted GNAT family N-acyltransferase